MAAVLDGWECNRSLGIGTTSSTLSAQRLRKLVVKEATLESPLLLNVERLDNVLVRVVESK